MKHAEKRQPTYIPAADLAVQLGISRQRVGVLIRKGKIEPPAIRAGRAMGYTPEQVKRIVQSRGRMEDKPRT